jgi:hypothetical protein
MNTYRVLGGCLAASALALVLSPLVARAQSDCEQIRRECLDYCRYGPVSPESGRDCKRECRKRVEQCQRGMRGAEGYPVLPERGEERGEWPGMPGVGAAPPGYGAPAAPAAGAPAAQPAAPATGQAAVPQPAAPPAPGYGYGYGAPGYGAPAYGAPYYGGAPYGGVPYGGYGVPYGGAPYGGVPYGGAPAAPRRGPATSGPPQ